MKRRMNSKVFKSIERAERFINELQKHGQIEIQIWELPDAREKTIYIVLWESTN